MTESTMTGDKPSDGLAVRCSPATLRLIVNQVQAVAEALKKLTKAHSFQLVSLQNEIERLKSEREKSQEQITAMKDLMKKLYTEMANLKGLVAKLKIEGFVQGTPIKTESRQSPELNGVEDHKDAGLLDTVRSYGGSIEELADDILRKERGRLVNTLVS